MDLYTTGISERWKFRETHIEEVYVNPKVFTNTIINVWKFSISDKYKNIGELDYVTVDVSVTGFLYIPFPSLSSAS